MYETLRSELIMQLICEDFNYDELSSELDNLLTEDESPIKLIGDLDSNKKVKKESDKISNEVEDLLNTDTIIDRLEKEYEEDINVNIDPNKDKELNVDINNNSKENINLNLSNKNSNKKIDVNIDNNSNKDNINVNLTNNQSFFNNYDNFDINNIKDNDYSTINLKLTSSILSNNNLNVKLKDLNDKEDNKNTNSSSNDKKPDLNVNLTNLTSNNEENKSDLFIKKRDELIEKANPNMKLSVCLKIIVDLKKSLEKLINFIPDEDILVRTKYLLGDLIDSILESSDLLLKDEKKLKEMIYKVFDTIISVNNYITDHYIKLEDKIDTQSKDSDNKQIQNQLDKVEINSLFKADDIINNTDIKATPNINRKKI